MTHQMNLQDRYYRYILHGTKRIELRLNDTKRQQIHIGDIITFSDSQKHSFQARVKGLLHYQTFAELFEDFDIELLADKSMTKPELLSVLSGFYTPELQNQHGVLGILLEILK